MLAIRMEDLINPEAILPVQFQYIWHGMRARKPEQMLLVAVLWQAVEDLYKHRDARCRRARRLYRDAYRWVASDDRVWPYSFLNACDLLGLHPGSMRAQLLGPDTPVMGRAA